MRGDRDRLLDILEAIERIERHADRGRKAFEEDELIQVWIVHHLQVIGEAARGLSAPLKDRHPGIPWRDIQGMRNIIVHEYFGIDVDVVWTVVESDLPGLKRRISAVLREVSDA